MEYEITKIINHTISIFTAEKINVLKWEKRQETQEAVI